MGRSTIHLWIKQGRIKAHQPGGKHGRLLIPLDQFPADDEDAA